MEKDHMLTTIDNPFNPFTDFENWYAFDNSKGYNTLGYLARICVSSNDLSEEDQSLAIEEAIDEIVKYNFLGIYKKISKDTKPTPVNLPGEGS